MYSMKCIKFPINSRRNQIIRVGFFCPLQTESYGFFKDADIQQPLVWEKSRGEQSVFELLLL